MRGAHVFAAEPVRTDDGVLLTSPLNGWFIPAVAPGARVTRGTLLGVLLVLAHNHRVVAPDVEGVVSDVDLRPHAIDCFGTLVVIDTRSTR